MDDTKIDRDPMDCLAKALNFLHVPNTPTSDALKPASETSIDADIKKACTAFLKLKSGDRQSALTMISTN